MGIALLWVMNFAISWFNAWSCGSTWDSTRARGGVAHFMNWMGAIMSSSGFTWCYLILLGLLASVTPLSWVVTPEEGADPITGMLLDSEGLQAFFDLGYMVIIFPILGSGLAITIQTWRAIARARQRRFGDYAITGWNTFAQVHNMYEASQALPGVIGRLTEFFFEGKDTEKKGRVQLIVVGLVLMAACAGMLTTYSIIQTRRRDVLVEESLRTKETTT